MATNPSDMSPDDFIAYLAKHGITETKQRGNEVSFGCVFHGCDDDHRMGEEFHLSFDCEQCVYFCLKCGEKGNYVTLRKHFGDYDEWDAEQKAKQTPAKARRDVSLETTVRKLHEQTREEVRDYFNSRGINNESIDRFMLGAGKFGERRGYMIPIFNKEGRIAYVKIRRTPEDEAAKVLAKSMGKTNPIPKYSVFPAGAKLLLVGEDELAKSASMDVMICEGELDRIIAIQNGVNMPVVTSGGGAQTFKDEWCNQLKNMRNIYLCFDNDEAGESGADKLAERLAKRIPSASIFKIYLPFEANTHADLTDYFVQKKGTAEELFTKYSEFCCGARPINASQFEEITVDDIASVLDSTIKYDRSCKVITFLAMLLAYTDKDQLNIMFNASSSTGKSYICHEVSQYFPEQDVNIYGKTTPTAFFYSKKLRRKDPETGESFIDLERRIMVFVEQPDTKLQENLRAVLSHEKKRVPYAITNKEKAGRNAADEGYILGYPSAFFCSANTKIDEQEQTRCLILSPDSTKQKVVAGIDAYIDKSCHRDAFDAKLLGNKERKSLMERVLYVKSLKVDTIDIYDSDYLKKRFFEQLKGNVPTKAMREIYKVTSLAKAIALINAPHRTIDGRIVVERKDIDSAVALWGETCESMVHSLPPQIFGFYKDIILPTWKAKNNGAIEPTGVSYKELRLAYYKKMGGFPSMETMRKDWMPTLELSNFVRLEKKSKSEGGDGREYLVTPLEFFDNDVEKTE